MVRHWILRCQSRCPAERGDRCHVVALGLQNGTELDVRLGNPRVQPDRSPKRGRIKGCAAKREMRERALRVLPGERSEQLDDPRLALAPGLRHPSEKHDWLLRVRIEPPGFEECRNRLGESSEPVISDSE